MNRNDMSKRNEDILYRVKEEINPILPFATNVSEELSVTEGKEYTAAVLAFHTQQPNVLIVMRDNTDFHLHTRFIENVDEGNEHLKEEVVDFVLDVFEDKPSTFYIPTFKNLIDQSKITLKSLERKIN